MKKKRKIIQARSFSERALLVVKAIPKGSVLTYIEVATIASNSKASRAVGNILSSNDNKNIPCHRVIKPDGKLGKYNGLRGVKMTLLKNEGYNI